MVLFAEYYEILIHSHFSPLRQDGLSAGRTTVIGAVQNHSHKVTVLWGYGAGSGHWHILWAMSQFFAICLLLLCTPSFVPLPTDF